MKFKKSVPIMIVIVAISLLMIPTISNAWTKRNIFWITFTNLGGQANRNGDFTQNDSTTPYQNYSLSISDIQHDGDPNNCSFCKTEITPKKAGLLGIYSNITSTKSISTPRNGSYAGANLGNVGTGKFRYNIKNNGAFSLSGTVTVNAQDTSS